MENFKFIYKLSWNPKLSVIAGGRSALCAAFVSVKYTRELPNIRQLGVVHESEMKKSAKLPHCNLRIDQVEISSPRR